MNDFLIPEAMLPRVAAPGPKTVFAAAIAALSLANCVIIAEVDYGLIPDESGGSGGGPPACTADNECNDDQACTEDRCVSGACSHTALAEGTDCGSETCVQTAACAANGECVLTPVALDDGNGCTTDACDPQSGAITHVPVNVDDNISCTTDSCDQQTGTITHAPSTPGCLPWQALPTEGAPSARQQHSAVWTGSKMIIWGGNGGGAEPTLNTGAVYDPANRTWSPVTLTGAPAGRHSHRAVWTGSRMLVWGGYAANGLAAGGGMYDPETDTWSPMTTTGEPALRIQHSALWVDTKMYVFGGIGNNNMTIAQGAAFDPMANTWTNLPTAVQPGARFNHTAIWTGDRMIIWGGQNYVDWLWTGSSYFPSTNTWMGPTPGTNVPEARELHCGVWTGTTMLVWGGWNGGFYLNSGGTFDPATSTWKAISDSGAPAGRAEHSGIWTGKNLVVWGGCGTDLCGTLYGDGGIFTPDASGGTWEPIPEAAPISPRRRHTTVWTGSSIIVWGGRDKSGSLGTGAEAALSAL